MSDTDMNYLQAITSVSAMARETARLERENTQLIDGAARQAKTIRTLNEELSKKDTEVQVERYNVEFFKRQGRKTRVINREKRKADKAKARNLMLEVASLKAELARTSDTLKATEAQRLANFYEAQRLTKRLEVRMNEIDLLRRGKPAPLPEVVFVTDEQVARARMTQEGRDRFTFTKTVRIDQLSMQMAFSDEHVGDLQVVEAIAKQAAATMARMLEDKIVETLMGKPMTRDERARAEYERRMKQQRQMYTDPGFRW